MSRADRSTCLWANVQAFQTLLKDVLVGGAIGWQGTSRKALLK